VWVVDWFDYTSEVGLGYLLSNGCIGVYLNDNSTILLYPNKK